MVNKSSILAVASIVLTITNLAFAYGNAISQFRMSKPLIVNISLGPPHITYLSSTFLTNENRTDYRRALVEIENDADYELIVDCIILVYDRDYLAIANASQRSPRIGGGASAVINVEKFDWVPGSSLREATSIDVILQETRPRDIG